MCTQKNHLNETVLLSTQNIWADPGIFVRGSQSVRQKKLTFFLFCFFLVLSLFYRSQLVNFKEIYHFSRFQRGSNIFEAGGPTFSRGGGGGGGDQLLIPYRNPYNLWFSRGGPYPLSPLWICTCGVADELEHRPELSLKVNCSAMHGID